MSQKWILYRGYDSNWDEKESYENEWVGLYVPILFPLLSFEFAFLVIMQSIG